MDDILIRILRKLPSLSLGAPKLQMDNFLNRICKEMDQSRRASAPWSYKAFVLALLFALANLLNLFGHLMALFVIATPFPFIAKEGFFFDGFAAVL